MDDSEQKPLTAGSSRPSLENNRFEALHQRWANRQRAPGRWRRRILWLLALFVAAELLSLVATFGWYWTHGVASARLLDQFVVTRYLVSPFVFDNPVKKYTKARYLGPMTNACVSEAWRQPDTLLGWSMTPNVGVLNQPYLVPDVVGWRFTNAQGFASSGDYDFFYERPKPRGTFRVIVTGASTVEGDGAESPKVNLPAQIRNVLEGELKGKLPQGTERIEVINAGVGGYQSSQEYLYLIADLVSYQPDLVISYSGAVDVLRAWNAYDHEGRVMENIRTFRHDIDTRYMRQSFTLISPIAMFASNVRRATVCLVDDLAIRYFIEKLYDKSHDLLIRLTGAPYKVLEPRSRNPDLSVPIRIGINSWSNTIKLMMKAAEIYNFRIAFALQPALSTDDKPLTKFENEMLNSLSASELSLRAQFWTAGRNLLAEYSEANRNNSRFCFIDSSQPFNGVHERVWDDTRHVLGIGNKIIAAKLFDGLKTCRQLPGQ